MAVIQTAGEAEQVRLAIIALASGQQVASVSYSGPPSRTATYHSADLEELKSLYAEWSSSQSASGSSGYRLAASRKGLG